MSTHSLFSLSLSTLFVPSTLLLDQVILSVHIKNEGKKIKKKKNKEREKTFKSKFVSAHVTNHAVNFVTNRTLFITTTRICSLISSIPKRKNKNKIYHRVKYIIQNYSNKCKYIKYKLFIYLFIIP